MIDLHTHSTASDGSLTPKELAVYASQKNLKAWALTDHDTVSGLFSAAKKAAELDLNFIPGVELNIAFPTGEFHLLGLGLRKYSEDLKSVLTYLEDERKSRNEQIIFLMKKGGYNFSIEEIENEFKNSQIGRPHIAKFLVNKKIVKNVQEAFQRYLAHGKPWYIPHAGENLETAVEAIKSAGGVCVLAHPMSLYLSWSIMEESIKKIRDTGVAGLEAFHPGARNSECYRLNELAQKLGMFVTGGSDYHGKTVRLDRRLGRTIQDKKIDDKFYFENLLPALGGSFDLKETDFYKQDL